MDKKVLIDTKKWIEEELFDYCIPFWLKNGRDVENGGVYTCLDREGKLYSTDKSVWMQGRCGYIFASLCNLYGARDEWLEFSKSCIDFLEEHCIDKATKRLYFTVTNTGEPLRLRRYCFSEAFYILANAEYYLATKDEKSLKRAREYYELVYKLNNGLIKDPVGLPPKTDSNTRSGKALADPMIYLNVTNVMRKCDKENEELYNKRAEECIDLILNYHFKPEIGYTLENVGNNGEYYDTYSSGRFVNPGHDMECSWFLMKEALRLNDTEIFNKAKKMFDMAFEKGWDNEYDGILYFIDTKNCPPENYEHDMKLWWPHNEALIASLMIYKETKEEKYLEIFLKVLEYCKKVFSDREYGEWYGYLRRDGLPTMPSSKGTTFKGPFHLPRMLSMCDKMLDEIIDEL
ncbi:MAG: AGE family epimerase/isomerase [Clostridia bacterium]